MTQYALAQIPSPLGPLKAVATDGGLAYLGTPGERPIRHKTWCERRLAGATRVHDLPALEATREQIGAYFAGSLRVFTLPLDLVGTDFQQRVWRELLAIPYGETTTYGEIAERIGSAEGERAVGSANGANTIAIVVPCHRVLGADGALTGYAGGMRTKAKLLAHEGRFRQPLSESPPSPRRR